MRKFYALLMAVIVTCGMTCMRAAAQEGNTNADAKAEKPAKSAGKSAAKSNGKSGAKSGAKAVGSQSSSAVKDAILKMEKELREANVKADSGPSEKYLADDYHAVSGANGQVYTKQQMIDRLKSGTTKFSEITPVNEDVIQFDHDLAIWHAESETKYTSDGKDASAKYQVARTWLKRNGKWQAIWFQTTRVQ